MRTINLLTTRATVALALALVGTVSPILAAAEPPDGTCKPEEIVAYAKKLNVWDSMAYVEQLGKAKDFRALEALYRGRCNASSYAANMTVQILDSDNAVAFCASLDIGSLTWCDAVLGLRSHPREKVIGYLKQVATSTDPDARYMCYEVCECEGWDDVAPFARNDADYQGPGPVVIPNLPPTESLSSKAIEYMKSLSKGKCASPNPIPFD